MYVYLVGDNVEFLLIFPLDVNCTLDPGQIGYVSSLHQRSYLLAGGGDTGKHDSKLGINNTSLFLLQKPMRQRLDLVAALLSCLGFRHFCSHNRAPYNSDCTDGGVSMIARNSVGTCSLAA